MNYTFTYETDVLEEFKEILPLIIPIILLQFILFLINIINLVKNKETRDHYAVWILVVLLGGLIGQIIYLVIGTKDEKPIE